MEKDNTARKKSSKKKSTKKETLQKEEKQKEEQQKEEQPKEEQPKEEQQKDINNRLVPLRLGFIKHLYNTMIIANQRSHWAPDELIPVGTMIKELNTLLVYYDSLEGAPGTGTSKPTSTS